MASIDEIPMRNQHNKQIEQSQLNRALPILNISDNHSPISRIPESMDTASPSQKMGPPSQSTPEESESINTRDGPTDAGSNPTSNATAASQTGTNQAPKVVQTAFIHKLYNMLEDQSIRHLIAWSSSGESFVMSPTSEFSKVLAQYFKHTNISSFVRQLNMYGFHKVSDVFQGGSPESPPLWEFKHGNGNFKRGDLSGLRDIKRRASRHTLIHRDTYPTGPPKLPPYPPPGMPIREMAPPIPEPVNERTYHMEQGLADVYSRLHFYEGQIQILHQSDDALRETLARSVQLSSELFRVLVSVMANPHSEDLHRSVHDMQSELSRFSESVVRPSDDQQDLPYTNPRPYLSDSHVSATPISPRQMEQDDLRRPVPQTTHRHQYPYRPAPAVPSHMTAPSRRYGSISNGSSAPSPSSLRYTAQTPQIHAPPQNHLITKLQQQSPPMNLARRHTSADIRETEGWRPNPSPFASGHPTNQWDSQTDRRPSTINEDQRIRDSFSSYSITAGHSISGIDNTRPTTPPPYSNGNYPSQAGVSESFGNWAWGSNGKPGGSGFHAGGLLGGGLPRDTSMPSTRRGSMAHILNPTETAEKDEDDEGQRDDDRKRKRLG